MALLTRAEEFICVNHINVEWGIEVDEKWFGDSYILTCPFCGEKFTAANTESVKKNKYCRNCGKYMVKDNG